MPGTSQIEKLVDEAGDANAQPFGFPLASVPHQYDGAGNLIDDGQRSYAYNALNLASSITKGDTGHEMTYLNGKVYRREGENDHYFVEGVEVRDNEFFALSFSDGRIVVAESGLKFQYRLTDHLGNTTVLFEDKNGDGVITEDINNPDASEVLQRELYYPFGLQLRGTAPFNPDVPQNYLYNGKEKIEGTGIYTYGFRYYDPTVARFTGVDPIADQFAFVSGYNYAENRPINGIDLHGLQYLDFNDIEKMPLNQQADIYLGLISYPVIKHNGRSYYNVGNHLEGRSGQRITSWLFRDISPVISKSSHESYYTHHDCLTSCKATIKNEGYEIGSYWHPDNQFKFQLFTSSNSPDVDIQETRQAGLDALHESLENGLPVIVGVDHSPGNYNPQTDKTTDHFIVIVGRGSDQNGDFFSFYENVDENNRATGTDVSKYRLYIQSDGTLKGDGYRTGYNVTQVRPVRKSN